MKRIIFFCLSLNSVLLSGQGTLIIESTTTNNGETGSWSGVNIQRSNPVTFTYRNNSITSVNASGYMLQAGDELPGGSNNNLKGEVVTGNIFTWNGTDMTSITHGVFTGYNINAVIQYNYLNKVPMGIIRKSNGMTNATGGVAYNIINNPVATGVVVKGMNGVNIYNNTFYSSRIMYVSEGNGTWRGLIDIYSNDSPVAASTGTKIKNNIFYTKNQIYNISIADAACLPGFESDYNVYYCESGTPLFSYLGSARTFAQWQALGYDLHSVVVNPGFADLVSFVPASRLDYGVSLGSEWQTGLSTAATWTVGSAPALADQNGKWQAGARIFGGSSASLDLVSAVIEKAAPSVVRLTYNTSLANIVPAPSAFRITVSSAPATISSVSVSGSTVLLSLSGPVTKGATVTADYTKPGSNPVQTPSGTQASSFIARPVVNNSDSQPPAADKGKVEMTIYPNPVHLVLNLLFEYTASSTGQTPADYPMFIRIFDITGKLVVEHYLETGATETVFPIGLASGIYIVQLFSNGLPVTAQKIIVY